MKKQRNHYTPEEKVAILRREQIPISELCDKQLLQPTVFYRWQKEFFENGAVAFQPNARPNHSAEQERIAYLEKNLGHDPRQNFALLSPIERKNRTLAQIAQRRVHPAGNAIVAGRC